MRKKESWASWAKQGQSPQAFMQNKANFCKGQMNANSLITKDYENKSPFSGHESKANQSQFVFFAAENTEYAEKNNICVSDCPIEKYALYPISPCSLRTRRLMKNKANLQLDFNVR
jgi:hypothetical protein